MMNFQDTRNTRAGQDKPKGFAEITALPDAIWFATHPRRRFRVRRFHAAGCEASLVVIVERRPFGYLDRHFRRIDDLLLIDQDDDNAIAEVLASPPSPAVGGTRWFTR